MGYFLESTTEADTPRRPHCPSFDGPRLDGQSLTPFEVPVTGFDASTQEAEKLMGPKSSNNLFNLRALWLQRFLGDVREINPEIPRDVAVEWVNVWMPPTADELRKSIMEYGPTQMAMRLADAWKAA